MSLEIQNLWNPFYQLDPQQRVEFIKEAIEELPVESIKYATYSVTSFFESVTCRPLVWA